MFLFLFNSLTSFYIHFLKLRFALLAYISTSLPRKRWQRMQQCAAEAAVPPASFKDGSVVSGEPFWRRSSTDCVCTYCMFGWFWFQITQWAYLFQFSACLLCCPTWKPNTVSTVFFLFVRADLRWEMELFHPIKHQWFQLWLCSFPQNMFIYTPPIPPFVTSCFISVSITQLPLSLGIACRLITFQEFNVMTGGQANFWGDKWWAKWLQSTGRQMVLWLHSEVAPACCVISGNVKEKERQRLSLSISKKQRDEIR